MKKRTISFVLVLVMIFSILPINTNESKAITAWDGISVKMPEINDEGIYLVSSAEELAWIAEYINSHQDEDNNLAMGINIELTKDIDLGDKEWTPISANSTYVARNYKGVFDGKGHTVKGIKITSTHTNDGLFGYVNGATIQNVNVEANISSAGNAVAGIVGKSNGTTTIINCSVKGNIYSSKSGTVYVGGVVGTINNGVITVKGSVNHADICGPDSTAGGYNVGGIIGADTKKGNISYCYNTGKIIGTNFYGGIVGNKSGSGSFIKYCYDLSGVPKGINGNLTYTGTVTGCYYLDNGDMAEGVFGSPISSKEELLSNLNGEEEYFVADSNLTNNGYPILKWEKIDKKEDVLVEKVTVSGAVKTGETVTVKATNGEDADSTNVTYKWYVSDDNIEYVIDESATTRAYTIPDTKEAVGKYLKVVASGVNDSTAECVVGPVEKSEKLIKEENAEKVSNAKDKLELETLVIKEATTIELPEMIDDCDIVWSSSNTDIISDEGVVKLPEANIETVKLTATISCGEENDTKTFNVDVWSKKIDPEEYLKTITDRMNFSALMPQCGEDTNIITKFYQILEKKGFDGVDISIKSTEYPDLVSSSGKIWYPKNDGGFAQGKQVKVSFLLKVGDATAVYPATDRLALLIPWDTFDIESNLKKSVDKNITLERILGDNKDANSVSFDLDLPSYIEGDKYSVGLVTWESSDEKHLSISNELRQKDANSFYNDYIGKVAQDGESHDVTLRAVIKNPSSDVTVKKEFDVTILPMSAEELEQTKDKMNKILSFYTADKLKDSASKEILDVDNVTNDIQLVIPKEVVTKTEWNSLDYGEHWDYWNYKFEVSSSDENTIEVNGFRAYVYRPLGENDKADKKVTLTVTMTSKANTNLKVSKDLVVKVGHLERTEINDALALMDAAKEHYADGIIGKNIDAYSIIDDMKPYQEITWNKEASGVDFKYSSKERTGDGVIVDELPGWQDQEDYRLFRSSEKDLIANETLQLQKTPEKDTFVTIDSVLTDETFGKYYNKFKDVKDYDKEALVKFGQLYKQPVHAYVLVIGEGGYTPDYASQTIMSKILLKNNAFLAYKEMSEEPVSVNFSLIGADGNAMLEKTRMSGFTKKSTVYDVFRKALSDNNISYESKGSYITKIGKDSEFDYGENSGWMYSVSGVYVNSYMNTMGISGDEDIVVRYVKNYKNVMSEIEQSIATSVPEVTAVATLLPTNIPIQTLMPTIAPTVAPTVEPTVAPTKVSATVVPTKVPATVAPTKAPTAAPTTAPTVEPTVAPTKIPATAAPTKTPTKVPTTLTPTKVPVTVSPNVKIQNTKKPSKVKGLRVSVKNNIVTVFWNKVKDVKTYYVQYGANKSFEKAKSKYIKKNAFSFKRSKKVKKYYVRVRAYKVYKGKKINGPFSAVKKINKAM